MVEVHTEQVLVVPTEVFHRLGHFQGFTADVDKYLDDLFDPEHMSYRPRHEVEEDPTFKQLIPYCVFRFLPENSIFQYTRGSGQGEGRLHAKRSIGIGGHISLSDTESDVHPYDEGMRRELDEEVVIETEYNQRCVGLINDDESDVGRVHLGVVHIFDVNKPHVHAREDDIVDAGFQPISQLLDSADQFETWSQICLESLFSGSS